MSHKHIQLLPHVSTSPKQLGIQLFALRFFHDTHTYRQVQFCEICSVQLDEQMDPYHPAAMSSMRTCWVLHQSYPIGCSACLVQAAHLSACRSPDFTNASHSDSPDRRSHIRANASPCNHSRLLLLQGKEPWNKGQQLHQQTCEKMSAAKQGHTVPRSVCAKMSRSHAGLRPSQV